MAVVNTSKSIMQRPLPPVAACDADEDDVTPVKPPAPADPQQLDLFKD